MQVISRLSGVFCPVLTPFTDELRPDPNRLIMHCRWLLQQEIGLAVFGTTSEANSLSVPERLSLLETLVGAGVDVTRILAGTGCCALTDTVQLTKHAVELGCAGVLMLPPFYYKDVRDEGVYANYAEVIERTGDDRLKIYLYHIPAMSGIAFSMDLIERLVRIYPDTIVGIKDSSGDCNNLCKMIERGWEDFRIFTGTESLLLQNMQMGGAGCISATANINAAGIHDLFAKWSDANAADLQNRLNKVRQIISQFPMIPALKSVVAAYYKIESWKHVRPPLQSLDEEKSNVLLGMLEEQMFSMSPTARKIDHRNDLQGTLCGR